jgi:hypothetical protein
MVVVFGSLVNNFNSSSERPPGELIATVRHYVYVMISSTQNLRLTYFRLYYVYIFIVQFVVSISRRNQRSSQH